VIPAQAVLDKIRGRLLAEAEVAGFPRRRVDVQCWWAGRAVVFDEF
jgi:hypothetical protein